MSFELVAKGAAENSIDRFLNDLGLGEYFPAFQDNEIDMEVLLELTEEEIKVDLGVTKLGH